MIRTAGGLAVILLLIAACSDRAATLPAQPSGIAADRDAASSAAPAELSAAQAQPSASSLDLAALHDRSDPARLLRLYAAAVAQGDWEIAARAWRTDAGVTAASLRRAYGGAATVQLDFGTGTSEGAAGSLYHTAPIAVRFPGGDRPERSGAIVLRRVNDVPGATSEQLDWRIVRSDTLEAPSHAAP